MKLPVVPLTVPLHVIVGAVTVPEQVNAANDDAPLTVKAVKVPVFVMPNCCPLVSVVFREPMVALVAVMLGHAVIFPEASKQKSVPPLYNAPVIVPPLFGRYDVSELVTESLEA